MEFVSDVGGGVDALRPSFFELAAQEQLRDLLSPVIRYILSVFAQRHPRYLLRIVNRHDELFALVMLAVERHYLRAWGASFAENFYGLKRRRVLPKNAKGAAELVGQSTKLSSREIKLSLLFLIGVPYVRAKAQDTYERLGGGSEDLFAASSQQREYATRWQATKARLESLFKQWYPKINVLFELYLLLYNVRYLFDKTPYWRPWFQLAGIEVRRMSMDDYRAAQETAKSLLASPFRRHSTTGLQPSFKTIIKRSIALVPLLGFEALKFLLPTSIFFFRFLEWWYASPHLRKKGFDSKALRAPKDYRSDATSTESSIEEPTCVVHGGPIVNPTALPTGWVGCYKCLFDYVSNEHRCPKTGVKVEVTQLRKING